MRVGHPGTQGTTLQDKHTKATNRKPERRMSTAARPAIAFGLRSLGTGWSHVGVITRAHSLWKEAATRPDQVPSLLPQTLLFLLLLSQ